MVCSTLLRFSASIESVTFGESVRFSANVTFLVCTDFLYTVLYCQDRKVEFMHNGTIFSFLYAEKTN